MWNDLMAGLVAGPALAPLASLDATGGGDAGSSRMASRGAVLGDRASSTGSGLPFAEAGDGDEGAGSGGGATRTAAASLEAGGPPLLVWLLAGLAALAVVAATPVLRRQRSGAVARERDPIAEPKANPDLEVSMPRPDRPAVARQTVSPPLAVPAARPPAPEPPRPPTPPQRTTARAVGLAVSSAASLAVGLAVRARRRSGSRGRRRRR